uniref:Uncharacterized protein n=1 Tax=Rhizophora mucronata TaxID=61149 RepID=A0A2P2QLE1_RHIMU
MPVPPYLINIEPTLPHRTEHPTVNNGQT